MIKTLLREVKEFKKPSILTPFFMILEVLMETIIPFLMASIIDEGVEAGDIGHIYRVGAVMIAAAVIGLCRACRRKDRGSCVRRTCKESEGRNVP